MRVVLMTAALTTVMAATNVMASTIGDPGGTSAESFSVDVFEGQAQNLNRSVTPGFVVLLETGISKDVSNWSDVLEFPAVSTGVDQGQTPIATSVVLHSDDETPFSATLIAAVQQSQNTNYVTEALPFSTYVTVSGVDQGAQTQTHYIFSDEDTPTPTPEPASLGVLALGVSSLLIKRRR